MEQLIYKTGNTSLNLLSSGGE